ncbi:hypothetical protein TNCT_592541, partial [Trichonephila clavata]
AYQKLQKLVEQTKWTVEDVRNSKSLNIDSEISAKNGFFS